MTDQRLVVPAHPEGVEPPLDGAIHFLKGEVRVREGHVERFHVLRVLVHHREPQLVERLAPVQIGTVLPFRQERVELLLPVLILHYSPIVRGELPDQGLEVHGVDNLVDHVVGEIEGVHLRIHRAALREHSHHEPRQGTEGHGRPRALSAIRGDGDQPGKPDLRPNQAHILLVLRVQIARPAHVVPYVLSAQIEPLGLLQGIQQLRIHRRLGAPDTGGQRKKEHQGDDAQRKDGLSHRDHSSRIVSLPVFYRESTGDSTRMGETIPGWEVLPRRIRGIAR